MSEENKETPDEIAAMPMDKMAKIYRKMQARISELTAVYETEVEGIKAQQEVLKNALKDQMLALGVKSVKTEQGTVMLGTKTRYHTSDWDAFKTFVVDHAALDLFEKRIAQSNMAQFISDNPGVVPPGLNTSTEYTISVRKPTT